MSSLSDSLPRFNIALFGEVLADVFPDVSILGGAPFNVTRHLNALGMHPVLVSRTGNDSLRDALLLAFRQLQLDESGLQVDSHYPTGQVNITFNANTHQFEILPEQAYDYIEAHQAAVIVRHNAPKLVYFGSLAQRHRVSRQALEAFLQASDGVVRFLDINLRAPWYDGETIQHCLQQANIVKLNDDELQTVAQSLHYPSDTLYLQAQRLLQTFNLQQVIVTAGAEGAWLLDAQTGLHRTSTTTAVPLVDTVGSGDAFASVYIIGLLSGWDMPTTLNRAHRFAGAICGVRGAAPQDVAFYTPFIKKWAL